MCILLNTRGVSMDLSSYVMLHLGLRHCRLRMAFWPCSNLTASIMVSTAYGSGIPGLKQDFGITDSTTPVLGISTYLLGLALGPLCLAPLSEMYGRRPIYIVAMLIFTVMLLPSALAQNFATLLVARFFAAFAGSVMISNAGGTLNDIATPETRAWYFSIWTLGVANGVSP